MLIVTSAALERLLRKLTHTKAADEIALRFTREDSGWRLLPDNVHTNDTTFAHNGRTVLLIDPVTSEELVGRTLDVGKKTSDRPRFRLYRNPALK